MTSKQIFDWYVTNVPRLILLLDEDAIIARFRTDMHVEGDFEFLWWNDPNWAPTLPDAMEYAMEFRSEKFQYLTMIMLFAGHLNNTRLACGSVQFPRQYDYSPLWTDVLSSLHQGAVADVINSVVTMPIWMYPIWKCGYFRHLVITFPRHDNRYWPIPPTYSGWTNTLAEAADISLNNASVWGNYLDNGLYTFSGDSVDDGMKRHNIIIWQLTKTLAQPRFWRSAGPASPSIEEAGNAGKVAVLALYQSVLYCRMLNQVYNLNKGLPGKMVVPTPLARWQPLAIEKEYSGYGTGMWLSKGFMLSSPELITSRWSAEDPPLYLGWGSLISNVWYSSILPGDCFLPPEPPPTPDTSPQVSPPTNESLDHYIEHGATLQMFSTAILYGWMVQVRRSLTFRKHPLTHDISAGLMGVPHPLLTPGDQNLSSSGVMAGLTLNMTVQSLFSRSPRNGRRNDYLIRTLTFPSSGGQSSAPWDDDVVRSTRCQQIRLNQLKTVVCNPRAQGSTWPKSSVSDANLFPSGDEMSPTESQSQLCVSMFVPTQLI